ncbi:MAG: TIM-barrel domain-containing protein [Gammaproteobacteria bacterium]
MYAVGAQNANYGLFLDHIYKQHWDFTRSPWQVESPGEPLRWYVMTGPNLPDLRQDYMELTGHPPVPPKKMFGLWISEYGFDNWEELESKLSTLRANKFPVDGFVLDLQWFGGITAGSDNSNMGRVTWDTTKFPDPAGKLTTYKKTQGIGIISIEESYVSRGLTEHADLKQRGFLVRSGCATCDPVYLDNFSDRNNGNWWGKGGMIDWTLEAAGDYWHDQKRQPLIQNGVIGHWIDLGEPEMYDADSNQDPPDWVSGVLPNRHGHADYHNLYNFEWAESIARGYQRNEVAQRPFMMARSGAAGIQRFGAAMWSGDIGSNLANLATHLNAQMHMSLSGVDYFGSDIGGFHRGALDGGDLNKMYTQWFANGMLFDVPGRPHTENLCNCKETAPDRIGDMASNLANVRARYELSPYLYSLAHRAYLEGEPVAPPLVYYYQNDRNVRELGSEKLLGRDLLVATVTNQELTQRDVYLPAGDWVDYHTHQWHHHSTGQTVTGQPVFQDGLFRLPTYARAGAMIPKMHVDDKTMNVLGKRTDGSTRNELVVRVYASSTPSTFTLYEDDGETIAYQSGAVRTTALSQQRSDTSATVVIDAVNGSYTGAPTRRDTVIELVVEDAEAKDVSLNGRPLPKLASRAAMDAANRGWFNAGNNLILAKSGSLNVSDSKTLVFTLSAVPQVSENFVCKNGTTQLGQSVYVVGNVATLGNWAPAKAVKLDPDGPYPTWTKTISKLPPSTNIEWKCIKRPENADNPVVWQPGG